LIIGNPSSLAIESSIMRAYQRLSFRALGFLIIYVGGRCYGRRSPDSTMLACSYDEIERRIATRGGHTAPFANDSDAGKIADAFRNAFYAERQKESYFGIPLTEFADVIQSNRIVWAPDGEEGFDDGSYVLQFDVRDRVRLIAFKSQGHGYDPATLSDVWLSGDDFYNVLQQWHDAFEAEWESTPKASEASS
jgi:hypothetical protein